MDPGERTTGTRNEHYGLVSVLYHALQGVENCNAYTLDAEVVGATELVSFFREAGVTQARLAERAKGMLGLAETLPEVRGTSEGTVPPGTASREVPPEPTSASRTPPDTPLSDESVELPSTGARRDPDLVFPDEDIVTLEEALPKAAQGVTHITSEDFDTTISVLEDDSVGLELGRALAEIEAWERKLEATGDPKLQAIAENLGALRGLLTADEIDASAGPLLVTLGEQVRGVASSELGAPIADKLRRLSGLLISEGRSLSG